MSSDADRCAHRLSSFRCGLVRGHASMHAARDGDAILHWRDPEMPVEHSRRVSLTWADPQDQG